MVRSHCYCVQVQTLVFFCAVSFSFILFCSSLFHCIPLHIIRFLSPLFYVVLFPSVLSCSVLFCSVVFYSNIGQCILVYSGLVQFSILLKSRGSRISKVPQGTSLVIFSKLNSWVTAARRLDDVRKSSIQLTCSS